MEPKWVIHTIFVLVVVGCAAILIGEYEDSMCDSDPTSSAFCR